MFWLLVHPCDKGNGPCENGGACQKEGEAFKCNCSEDFTGELCEKKGKWNKYFKQN